MANDLSDMKFPKLISCEYDVIYGCEILDAEIRHLSVLSVNYLDRFMTTILT